MKDVLTIVGVFLCAILLGILVRDVNTDAEYRTKDVCYRAAYTQPSQEKKTEYYDNCMKGAK